MSLGACRLTSLIMSALSMKPNESFSVFTTPCGRGWRGGGGGGEVGEGVKRLGEESGDAAIWYGCSKGIIGITYREGNM